MHLFHFFYYIFLTIINVDLYKIDELHHDKKAKVYKIEIKK